MGCSVSLCLTLPYLTQLRNAIDMGDFLSSQDLQCLIVSLLAESHYLLNTGHINVLRGQAPVESLHRA